MRVPNAICERKTPEPKDIEELNRLAPQSEYLLNDERACEIINATIEEQKKTAV